LLIDTSPSETSTLVDWAIPDEGTTAAKATAASTNLRIDASSSP
jgi:hypothetical protein